MDKVNIAEILKNCPKGTKLYSPLCGECEFFKIKDGVIYVESSLNKVLGFNSLGMFYEWYEESECLLFPSKENRDWDTFQVPFKNGDIVSTNSGMWIGIVNHPIFTSYATYIAWNSHYGEMYYDRTYCFERLATEEEKQKLFQAIKDNGYRWNAKTKILEELIVPKFKVGDKIRHKTTNKNDIYEISKVYDDSYGLVGFTWMIYMKYQDNYELVPNKFDITTLKPFDKVLVRNSDKYCWTTQFFSFYNPDSIDPFKCLGQYNGGYTQCVPYESNEHLLGTYNDCDEFYKTWEE